MIYRIETNSEPVYMDLDLAQSASNIRIGYADPDNYDEISWEASPHQVADAGHDLDEAADLAVSWAYRDDPADEQTTRIGEPQEIEDPDGRLPRA